MRLRCRGQRLSEVNAIRDVRGSRFLRRVTSSRSLRCHRRSRCRSGAYGRWRCRVRVHPACGRRERRHRARAEQAPARAGPPGAPAARAWAASYEEYCEHVRASGPGGAGRAHQRADDQRHLVLPREPSLRGARLVHVAGGDEAQRRLAPHPHLVRGLLDGRGAVLRRDGGSGVRAGRGAGTSRSSRPTSTAM